MNDNTNLDVLIVGGGPAGTTLGIELRRRGIDVRIVDKASSGFAGSRAKGIQPRTLEIMEDLGALDDILDGGSLYPRMGIHAGPLVVPWAMIKVNKPSERVPYPSTWLIPQHRTDRALHHRLEELGGRIDYQCEVYDLEQDENGVTVEISTPTGDEAVRAKFVVGADGGSSVVRKSVGIAFEGTTDEEDRMLIVDAVVEGDLSRKYWHIWPVGGKFVGACPLPDSNLFQWMIKLDPDETPPTTAEAITGRVRARTKKKLRLTDIAWQSVFRPNIRIAAKYRKGRVLLVGDAAHVHPPAGAQGLNTGVQDSYNLGWKLAGVLQGASDTLLDSYEAERQPVAATVLGLATKKYDAIATMSPAALARGKDEYQLAVTYNGGPLASSANASTSTLAAGDRAPDARLDRDGTTTRLFELFRGTHFTAIAYGPGAPEALASIEWPTFGAELRTIAIDASNATADDVVSDIDRSFRSSYGVSRPTAFLVRPDGYIAAIALVDELEPITAVVSTMTSMS